MNKYLYRYISFESFVDMIQRKVLTFSLPTEWDDTKELCAYQNIIDNSDDGYKSLLMLVSLSLTSAQCWTKLKESDAMWRIYNYSNMTVRLKVKRSLFSLLGKNIEIRDVDYNDSEKNINKILKEKNDPLQLLAVKRKAFSHEKEVRIIDFYRYTKEDAYCKLDKMVRVFNANSLTDYLEKNTDSTVESVVNDMIQETNINKAIKTKSISFAHIENFVSDVMVHPMAPEWFVNTVKTYCELNNLKFVGKSELYME